MHKENYPITFLYKDKHKIRLNDFLYAYIAAYASLCRIALQPESDYALKNEIED